MCKFEELTYTELAQGLNIFIKLTYEQTQPPTTFVHCFSEQQGQMNGHTLEQTSTHECQIGTCE